ncbi:MAG: thiamine pyrophosphate-dependent dehydrogenase E1 component subunit alpha [Anaerolineae bacterium]|nr:thiamine pyrophosphate-dependent dehydrogenase E1 component subunit alpha [Anaerolineae bacterium]MCO5187027.1 thiamine pyrophosphate-dependent dehydrogenase E1 component subunit alpha [Anaerolineae bacterium]MCO5195207.1 thiamine pyrophosphate-dependent dehydrogenase E1 component subunit alpha [Anaerolineae bacterium]MCO5198240.1 thiamine pyrophosphate-dependent dehydrogenase E1 component subunit alpha [Anaerolineae bacterium]
METKLKESGLDSATLLEALRKMHLIRLFEEKAESLYALGKIHGTMHLSIGQEASAVGSCLALQPDDYILSTHRGHGHCIGKGAEPKLMMAEFFGKEVGYCRGRGGSMHIADVAGGNLGANGIVAGGIPLSTGVGLSIQMQQQDKVCLTFFGDGAANEGAFHESLNLAAIWDLPVVYICENNQYGMSMSVERACAVQRIAQRAAAYDIPGMTVDGNDLFAVYGAVKAAVDRARTGDGPMLIESVTYRWRGHSKSDRQRYRSRDEVKEWMEKDPIARLEKALLSAEIVSEADLEQVANAARKTIEDSVAFAEAAADPDPASILEGVYA